MSECTEANYPAFPVLDGNTETSMGITKRQYFAAKAMQGMLANSYHDGDLKPLSEFDFKNIRDLAYFQADLMLEVKDHE
jgi:hypothetical protein